LALATASISQTTPPVTFKVQLQWDNETCVTNAPCSVTVYRSICYPPTPCPVYAQQPEQFMKMPVADSTNSSQVVTATNTHFMYLDNDKAIYPLQYANTYTYAVMNSFLAYPSYQSAATQVTVVTPTGLHQATVNWSSPSCRTASPCTLQVYRATCTSATSCPAYTPGSSAWTALSMNSSHLTATVGAQGTGWVYTDNDKALVGATTFEWIATSSYTGASSSSPASTAYIGTTGTTRTITVHPVPLKETK